MANQISVLADQLKLPAAVDRTPWTGNKRRLLRLVGACKEGEAAYLKPVSTANNRSIHPLHDHILTFVKGSEYDLTLFVSGHDSPSLSSALTESAATQRRGPTQLRLGSKLKMRTSTDYWPRKRSADWECGAVTSWEQPGFVRPGEDTVLPLQVKTLLQLLQRVLWSTLPVVALALICCYGTYMLLWHLPGISDLQSNYDKMKSEVPKYKMITPSILADRLRVSLANPCSYLFQVS